MARTLTRILCILLPCGLAACAGPRTSPLSYAPERSTYPAPGPQNDPWRPYVSAASQRFGVPAPWIRAVIHQESGGHEYLDGQPITSAAGAMGLMQLMPATYADLQAQYGLGSDPYDPHDNIMAGTGYIRQMFDRYGSPGFLAAYNAGPARVDDYLAGQGSLPNETVNYVASIAPHLGAGDALAPAAIERAPPEQAPIDAAPPVELAAARAGDGCWHDPDRAFDPAAPCEPRPAPPSPALVAQAGCASADPDSAFDPGAPCRPIAVAVPVQEAVYRPAPSAIGAYVPLAPPSGIPAPPPPIVQRASYAPTFYAPAPRTGGAWAIQVGAFGRPGEAQFATAMARDADPGLLAGTREVVMPVPGLGAGSLYRARLAGLDRAGAASACAQLRGRGMPCMPVQPGG